MSCLSSTHLNQIGAATVRMRCLGISLCFLYHGRCVLTAASSAVLTTSIRNKARAPLTSHSMSYCSTNLVMVIGSPQNILQ
jgi:hypothetical protein